MEELIKRRGILDPESDDAIEVTHDLIMYQSIMEKINEREEV